MVTLFQKVAVMFGLLAAPACSSEAEQKAADSVVNSVDVVGSIAGVRWGVYEKGDPQTRFDVKSDDGTFVSFTPTPFYDSLESGDAFNYQYQVVGEPVRNAVGSQAYVRSIDTKLGNPSIPLYRFTKMVAQGTFPDRIDGISCRTGWKTGPTAVPCVNGLTTVHVKVGDQTAVFCLERTVIPTQVMEVHLRRTDSLFDLIGRPLYTPITVTPLDYNSSSQFCNF